MNINSKNKLHKRKTLPHHVPDWVSLDSIYFITISCKPKGLNQLCHNDIFKEIKKSALFYQNIKKWFIHYFLVMPDHLHALISFTYNRDLKLIISDWKRYTARELEVKWQRDFLSID